MSIIKSYKQFNESTSSWHPTFKTQGEYIHKKDDVTIEELEKIASYFRDVFEMDQVASGEILKPQGYSQETAKSYGVIGHGKNIDNSFFWYYYRDHEDPELRGWIGQTYIPSKPVRVYGHYMSPLQFLECVEMHYFYSSKWTESVSKAHIEKFEREMTPLISKQRHTRKISGKYGL